MDDRQHAGTIADVLTDEAETLASQYGIDAARAYASLERGLRACAQDPQRHAVADGAGDGIPDTIVRQIRRHNVLAGGPSLGLALESMGPAIAFQLFENGDLRQLKRREDAASYLLNGQADGSLFTTDELATAIGAFADHLEQRREDLLRTGWGDPNISGWIAFQLGNHLPTKDHAGIGTRYRLDGHEVHGEEVRVALSSQRRNFIVQEHFYIWEKDAGNDAAALTRAFIACTYDEAPTNSRLHTPDVERVESLRGRLLELKIAVLRQLERSLRTRDAANLWQLSLHLITEVLPAPDAEFLLAMDRISNGWDVFTGELADDETADWDGSPGGLTALFEVIGHCEEELAVGWLHHIKATMPPGVRESDAWNYYMVPESDRTGFDASLDRFLTLDREQQAFWADYRRRVNTALENEFYDDVLIPVRVRRKVRGTFEPLLRSFADFQLTHHEATGAFAPVGLASPVQAHEPRSDIRTISCDGTIRSFDFAGTRVSLRDTKGLRYLTYLLQNPGHDIHVLALVGAIDHGGAGSMSARPLPETIDGNLRVDRGDGSDPVLDAQAVEELQRRALAIRDEIEDARNCGNDEQAEALLNELEQIEQVLQAARGLGGRTRIMNSNAERARNNISKQVNRAIQSIREAHPTLGLHLECVRIGFQCAYEPPG